MYALAKWYQGLKINGGM